MKFVDFTSLFDTEPAHLAILSTFQFDADFFERRLLRSAALAKARRILVFMDARQWSKMLEQDVPARLLNRRYLVVPIRPPNGVFHPKLNLLARRDGFDIQCGSNNLTRSGCTSNLELLNSLSTSVRNPDHEATSIARAAYAFFKTLCDYADQETGRIALQWLDELPRELSWLAASTSVQKITGVRLLHTYGDSLWEQFAKLNEGESPGRFLVISPYFDERAELAQRILQRWPNSKIEIVAQQKTTTLPVIALKTMGSRIVLSEMQNSSRRLHGKLLAWETPNGTSCIVGSANFTTAAFDGRNVEACLLIPDAEKYIAGLFDGQLGKRLIALEDFESGTEGEPDSEELDATALRLTSALLTQAGELKVSYKHRLAEKPLSLRVAIRTPGEHRPRAFLNVPNTNVGNATLVLPEAALKDAHGTILASLTADIGGTREESPSIWVIQEGRLTYDSCGEGSSSTTAQIEESGEGLTEFLEELGKRDGVAAVIEYLRHLKIRFNDGGNGLRTGRMMRLRISDPFHPDVAPQWLLNAAANTADLSDAINDFVERHEHQCLRKHTKRGNINGMENFLDVFTALIRLLYVYYVRGVVHRMKLIGDMCGYVEIATCGFENSEDNCGGYLYAVDAVLNDSDYLQEVCKELNFVGHIEAVFIIVQKVRYDPNEIPKWGTQAKRLRDCLPDYKKRLQAAIEEVGLKEPSKSEVMKALTEYNMFSVSELAEFEKELSEQ